MSPVKTVKKIVDAPKGPEDKKPAVLVRAIRLELAKPLSESWETAGPLMRTLAKATPKLLNTALDARIAIEVAGRDAVKDKIAPKAKANSADGLAYQAILRGIDRLREWGEKKKHPFANLEVPGGMASAIARAASQAYARRDQQRPHFASERILIRATECEIESDEKGTILIIKLRSIGVTRFAVRHSIGTHRETLAKIVSKELPHGDCKIQYDKERKKWYALIAYETPIPQPIPVDMSRVLVVHRGVRNALYLLSSTGECKAVPGGKFLHQRRMLQARMRSARKISEFERGNGSKGHGRTRRYESYSILEDKLARVTHTFCQQTAAFISEMAKRWGCGLVVIEDYGGIEPHKTAELRRVLERFPLYELKQCIAHRLEKDGISLIETPSAYISSTCPRCGQSDPRWHNTRTNTFHCGACPLDDRFERPADWVASYWMLTNSGADMTIINKLIRQNEALRTTAKDIRRGKGDNHDCEANDLR